MSAELICCLECACTFPRGHSWPYCPVCGARYPCPECDGDGLVVVGWDDDAYENIEGPCPRCRPPRAPAAPEADPK